MSNRRADLQQGERWGGQGAKGATPRWHVGCPIGGTVSFGQKRIDQGVELLNVGD
jgi:hypothetical protein